MQQQQQQLVEQSSVIAAVSWRLAETRSWQSNRIRVCWFFSKERRTLQLRFLSAPMSIMSIWRLYWYQKKKLFSVKTQGDLRSKVRVMFRWWFLTKVILKLIKQFMSNSNSGCRVFSAFSYRHLVARKHLNRFLTLCITECCLFGFVFFCVKDCLSLSDTCCLPVSVPNCSHRCNKCQLVCDDLINWKYAAFKHSINWNCLQAGPALSGSLCCKRNVVTVNETLVYYVIWYCV